MFSSLFLRHERYEQHHLSLLNLQHDIAYNLTCSSFMAHIQHTSACHFFYTKFCRKPPAHSQRERARRLVLPTGTHSHVVWSMASGQQHPEVSCGRPFLLFYLIFGKTYYITFYINTNISFILMVLYNMQYCSSYFYLIYFV